MLTSPVVIIVLVVSAIASAYLFYRIWRGSDPLFLKVLYSGAVWAPIIGPVCVAWIRAMPEPQDVAFRDLSRYTTDVTYRWRRILEQFGIVEPLRRLDDRRPHKGLRRPPHPATSLATGNLALACVGAMLSGLGCVLAFYAIASAFGLPFRESLQSTEAQVDSDLFALRYGAAAMLAFIGGLMIASGKPGAFGFAVAAPCVHIALAILARLLWPDHPSTPLSLDVLIAALFAALCAVAFAVRTRPDDA